MSKIRIYQLAKDLDLTNKELLDLLKQLGVEAKSHASTIEEATAEAVKTLASEKKPAAAPAKEKPAAARPPAAEETIAEVPPPPPPAVPAPPPPAPPSPSPAAPIAPELKALILPPEITLRELADKTRVEPGRLVSKLMESGIFRGVHQRITAEAAEHLMEPFGFKVQKEGHRARGKKEKVEEDASKLASRPPVVTVMGHVDHGKTKLLDAIRKTNVTEQEAGGITQQIGASEVVLKDHKRIVFLDTPGHEAFTAMRARGAQVTDIAVLVVAADDGVMPQTIEAIDHARAASVPILVAINKIDKPEANQDRVKHQLSELDLIPEEWGGDTICVSVSAKENRGIEDLLEMILLVAEMTELKANAHAPASGTVIEARLDPQKGPTATVLVQRGTLRVGDAVVIGTAHGKIRSMVNWKNQPVTACGPSGAVSVFGMASVPQAGDPMMVVSNTKAARQQSIEQAALTPDDRLKTTQRVRLDDLFSQIKAGAIKDLNMVIKADVRGSAEALCQSLRRMDHEEVRVNIIHHGVGSITDSDIMLASASNAIVIGFNVQIEPNARIMADRMKVDVRLYAIIYDALNDVEAAILGMLEPTFVEKKIGEAEVRALFKSSRVGTIAGCVVTSGRIIADCSVKVFRGKEEVFAGKIDSLRHVREIVKEVVAGTECGIHVAKFHEIQEGDVIHGFITEEVARTLDSTRSRSSVSR